MVSYLGECREMGIDVLPPDANTSDKYFTVIGGDIRFGLAAVKGVGRGFHSRIVDDERIDGRVGRP